MSFRRIERDRARGQIRRITTGLDGRVLLAGEHVRVGHDDFRLDHPAGALDRQAAGGAEHAHDAARGAPHTRRPRDGRLGRGDVRRGAGDLGQGVEPRERVQDRAGRRQQLVELAQDRRALDVRAQRALARRLRRHGCEDPDDAQTEGRAERRAEQAVEQAQAREEQRAPQPEAQTLQPTREDRAGQQRADQPEGGRVWRGGSAGQQKRTQASSEECTKREPAEGEHPDDEAPPEAESRRGWPRTRR